MTTIRATFDGQVLRPEEPLPLAPNTRVLVTIEAETEAPRVGQSFLRTAQSLNLEGPCDWSERLEHYLYGEKADSDD